MEIILASQSPRRRELLERMGLSFSVRAADIDEAMEPGKDPAQEVAQAPGGGVGRVLWVVFFSGGGA